MRHRIKKILVTVVSAVLLTCLLGGCSREETQQVSLVKHASLNNVTTATSGPSLRIAMGAMITPRDGFYYYDRMKKYIGRKLGQPVQLVDRESYDEINRMLETGHADVGFVCAGPYVEGREKFSLELLAMPLVKGKPLYHSYIIVPRESKVTSLKELRGKSFAFSDPKSNSGKLVPTYMLSLLHETPDTFFAKYTYTYAHDRSIKAVAQKLVDGAAVDSLIWEYTNLTNPDVTSQTRIVEKSAPYGIPPVVVRPDLPAGLKKRLLDIFLGMHEDPEGAEILKGMMIDRFVAGDDGNYDSVREIRRWIRQQPARAAKR